MKGSGHTEDTAGRHPIGDACSRFRFRSGGVCELEILRISLLRRLFAEDERLGFLCTPRIALNGEGAAGGADFCDDFVWFHGVHAFHQCRRRANLRALEPGLPTKGLHAAAIEGVGDVGGIRCGRERNDAPRGNAVCETIDRTGLGRAAAERRASQGAARPSSDGAIACRMRSIGLA